MILKLYHKIQSQTRILIIPIRNIYLLLSLHSSLLYYMLVVGVFKTSLTLNSSLFQLEV